MLLRLSRGERAERDVDRRVQPGVYASLTLVETALPPPPLPLLYQLRDVSDRGGRAMTIAEILAAAGVPESRHLSATGMLSTLFRKGLVRRVDAGVYAPLHDAVVLDPPTLEASILATLAKHPEGSTSRRSARGCARTRGEAFLFEETRHKLADVLCAAGVAARLLVHVEELAIEVRGVDAVAAAERAFELLENVDDTVVELRAAEKAHRATAHR